MSIFDAKFSVHSASVGATTEEAIEAGMLPSIELMIAAGMALPFNNPQTGEPLVIPAGALRFQFTKEQAIELFEKGLEAAQSLPDSPSGKIMTASNLADVEEAAKRLEQVTGR